jgi:hypothetical protein
MLATQARLPRRRQIHDDKALPDEIFASEETPIAQRNAGLIQNCASH